MLGISLVCTSPSSLGDIQWPGISLVVAGYTMDIPNRCLCPVGISFLFQGYPTPGLSGLHWSEISMFSLIAFGISQTWSEPIKNNPSLSLPVWLSDKYGINLVYYGVGWAWGKAHEVFALQLAPLGRPWVNPATQRSWSTPAQAWCHRGHGCSWPYLVVQVAGGVNRCY